MKAYLVPIVGKGTADDPYRASVADSGINHAAYIPTDKDGYPLNSQALILINDSEDWKMADWPSASSIPAIEVETTMDTLDNALS